MTNYKGETGYAEALRRIEVCRKEWQADLDLSDLNLAKLPPSIGQLTALTTLDLNINQLTTLPPEIGLLIALTTLHLTINSLTTLPPEIGQLTALTTLTLKGNPLKTLPPEFGQLTALRSLVLASNSLSTLPLQISKLTALTTLDLNGNNLVTLPPEIGQLIALKTLYLHNNKLKTLPPEISKLKALSTLNLHDNQIVTLPPEIGGLTALTSRLSLARNMLTELPPEIGQLRKLKMLGLDGNKLTKLPPEIGQLSSLKVLFLHDNPLKLLPKEICQLTALTGLYLHGNPALSIPDSILGRKYEESNEGAKKTSTRPQDILNYYFAQRQGVLAGTLRSVNEIKVMLVGRGGAGKTSLRRFFMGKPHDMDEKETPGIALDSFQLSCSNGEMTVWLWDFAGQEITHALHQFFLTEGCIYVLVLEPRSNTEMQDAEYWLGMLKRYAADAPVLVALNRQDSRQGGYDVDRRMLQERFPFIHSFTATNCENREGCSELRQKLCDAVESLKETEPPHLRVPETWLKVMEDCAGEARGKRQHMTIDEFREICANHGENDSIQQESLARLLHKLGTVLHFIDEPRLRDTSVLNPHWVTNGVYRLLRFKDRPGSDGTLTLTEALQALPGETEETARFLLRLMERFEMCFPLDEEEGDKLATKWLIPGALGEFQPEGVTADWQKPGSVRLRYIYDPLPEGVLPRFIVMTHLLSEGKPRWRNGVVLGDGQAAALVRRGEKRNHVEVAAFGPEAERLRLLEIIQGNLERIHADLPDPKPVAEVELAGLTGIFRPVADLEAAEVYEQQVAVDIGKGKALVEPSLQLNRTSDPEARGSDRVPLNLFLSYSHINKGAKAIFQDNLTVMKRHKLISPWHDGLIEPGMRWREEIEDNLTKMDVFVGLLTTAFLASDFIEKVELRAARNRLAKEDRDFLFVLILVEDGISLGGLEDAGYQILIPAGKAISLHKNRRIGFNFAQKELEQLCRERQELKKQQKRDEPAFEERTTKHQDKHGISIIVQGDYIMGDKSMSDYNSINIGGSVINSQVGQTLTNCTNMVQQQAPGERKDLLEKLTLDVKALIERLPKGKTDEAPQIVENLEMIVKQATSEKPKREWYSLSAKGLLEAAKWVKDFSVVIGGTIQNLGKSIWPNYELPATE